MSNVLNLVAPSFIGISYLNQAMEMKMALEKFGAQFDLPVESDKNEDAFLNLLPQLIKNFPMYFDNSVNSDAEVEAAFFSVISMIQLLSQVDQIEAFSKDLSNAVFNHQSDRVALKSKLLGHQLNCYQPLLKSTYDLLTNVLRLVKETKQVRHVILDIKQIVGWLVKWNADIQEQRDIFRLLHEAFSALNEGENAIEALVQLLRLYTENEAVEAKSDAHLCVISHIAHPKIFVMDHLLDLHPIRALDGQLIYELLQIFVTGDINDYVEFYNNNIDFVEKLAVTHDENLKKMRLLTLASMAQGCEQLEFCDLIENLKLEKDEVEAFVIEAIGAKLIRGKINEPEEKVLICSTTNRTFTETEWNIIKNKLESWQKNLNAVQESMKSGYFTMPIGTS